MHNTIIHEYSIAYSGSKLLDNDSSRLNSISLRNNYTTISLVSCAD